MELSLKLLLKVSMIFLYFSTQAMGRSKFNWNLQITDPQFNLSYFQLPTGTYKPHLKKTSWRCWIKKVQTKNGPKGPLEMREFHCNYSIKKSAQVTTFLSCSKEQSYGENILKLTDQKKNLTFKLMLTCRKN